MWLSYIQWIVLLSTYEFIIKRAAFGVKKKKKNRVTVAQGFSVSGLCIYFGLDNAWLRECLGHFSVFSCPGPH